MKKRSKLGVVFGVIKRKLKFRYLLFLALMLTFNTFAWFIYLNKVDSNISVKVKAWNITFDFDGSDSDFVTFTVSDIYPGMNDNVNSLKVTNNGDLDAELSYDIISASIFGREYSVEDYDEDITGSELLDIINQDYPFSISIGFTNDILARVDGIEYFQITTSWDFESYDDDGNLLDDDDTYWGNLAYSYMQDHDTCMEIKVKITAKQINDN